LRYRSDFDGPFNFSVGGQYWKEEVDQIARSINIFCIPALPPNVGFGPTALPASCGTRSANEVVGLTTAIPRDNGRDIESQSIYGLLEYSFASTWKVTAEARYSDEDETVIGTDCATSVDIPAANAMAPVTTPVPTGEGTITLPPNFPFPGFQGTRCGDWSLIGSGFTVFGPSINFLYPVQPPPMGLGLPAFPSQANGQTVVLESGQSFVTPRFTIETKPNDSTLIFASWTRAVKPGGVSTVAGGAWQDPNFDGNYEETTVKDEILTQVELGAKLTLLDGRLRLNPDVFFAKYKDKQVGAQVPTPSGILTGRLLNAGKAEIKGFELDGEWAATDNILFRVNYSYLDAEFTDFPFTSASSTDAARFGSCPRSAANQYRVCEINLKGNKLERVPEHSLVAVARYSRPMGDLFGSDGVRWFIETDWQVQSERYIEIWNNVELDKYAIGNLRVGITSDKWDALVFVNNVTDSDTVLTGNGNPGDVDQSLFDPTNFSPADTVGVSLPDPRIVGVRFAYRFSQE
jgi:outer membrane receptor protein involved in Fe transport